MSNLIRSIFWDKNTIPTRWGRPLPARHFQILVIVHVDHVWVQVENPFAFRGKFGWSKVSPLILFLDKYIFFKLETNLSNVEIIFRRTSSGFWTLNICMTCSWTVVQNKLKKRLDSQKEKFTTSDVSELGDPRTKTKLVSDRSRANKIWNLGPGLAFLGSLSELLPFIWFVENPVGTSLECTNQLIKHAWF